MRNGYDPGSPNYDAGPPDYNPGPAFKVSSGYGFRRNPTKKFDPTNERGEKEKSQFHSGQDYAAPAGTSIPNAASGVVVYSGFNKDLGDLEVVRNDRGDYSLYGHMQDGDRAKLGQRISEGDTIGLVGGTGARARGVHLHYSVIRPEAGKVIESLGMVVPSVSTWTESPPMIRLAPNVC
jgi:murein DD-endopeptidase MepM/ murein hydrolase activator NlpD